MTINEFLIELEKTPANWELNHSKRIRYKCHCPISAVAENITSDRTLSSGRFVHAGRLIGLEIDNIYKIIRAADDDANKSYVNLDLRNKLLKACKLV